MTDILIVDDDDIIADLASLALKERGHSCRWATSGEEAMALLDESRPDLILLEQDLPDIAGLDWLRDLRASPRDRLVPVLVFTHQSSDRDDTLAIYYGAQECIRKPFEPSELVARVERWLGTSDRFLPRGGHAITE